MSKKKYREAYATLVMAGETLDPLDVTMALRLPPDWTARSGEPRLRRTPKGVIEHAPYRHGTWKMSSKHWVDGAKVATHIEWILAELEPKADIVRELTSRIENAVISCYAYGTVPDPPSYPQALDARAADLGLSVDIDYYSSSEGQN